MPLWIWFLVLGNIQVSLDLAGIKLNQYLLLNKEHSKGGSGLEGLTKFPNPVGGRRVVLIQVPFAQT